MGAFWGVQGRVQLGSNLLNVTKWSISEDREVFDTTTLNTATTQKFKSFAGGHTEWSGSLEGYLDDTTHLAVSDLNTTFTATLTDGDGATYVGTVILTNISPENAHDDLGKYTASFQGSGTLTIT